MSTIVPYDKSHNLCFGYDFIHGQLKESPFASIPDDDGSAFNTLNDCDEKKESGNITSLNATLKVLKTSEDKAKTFASEISASVKSAIYGGGGKASFVKNNHLSMSSTYVFATVSFKSKTEKLKQSIIEKLVLKDDAKQLLNKEEYDTFFDRYGHAIIVGYSLGGSLLLLRTMKTSNEEDGNHIKAKIDASGQSGLAKIEAAFSMEFKSQSTNKTISTESNMSMIGCNVEAKHWSSPEKAIAAMQKETVGTRIDSLLMPYHLMTQIKIKKGFNLFEVIRKDWIQSLLQEIKNEGAKLEIVSNTCTEIMDRWDIEDENIRNYFQETIKKTRTLKKSLSKLFDECFKLGHKNQIDGDEKIYEQIGSCGRKLLKEMTIYIKKNNIKPTQSLLKQKEDEKGNDDDESVITHEKWTKLMNRIDKRRILSKDGDTPSVPCKYHTSGDIRLTYFFGATYQYNTFKFPSNNDDKIEKIIAYLVEDVEPWPLGTNGSISKKIGGVSCDYMEIQLSTQFARGMHFKIHVWYQ